MTTEFDWNLVAGPPSSIADWDLIENAIQTQIALASGLPSNQVIWSHQSGDRHDRDFIVIEHLGATDSAPATPEIQQTDTPGVTVPAAGVVGPGGEITLTSRDNVDFSVRLMFYTRAATGKSAARARLGAVRGYLGTDDVSDALDASNVALIECGTVQPIPVVLETKFESRASLEVLFRTVDGYSVKATIIQTVNAGIQIPKSDGTPSTPAIIPVTIVQP